ncbi:MAG: adenylate kinase, partial [Prochlorococcus sp.]
VIRHRLEVYREKTAPLIDHYRQQGLLETVEAHGNIEAITSSIEAVLC